MNRRSFFAIIAAGLSAAADPERLLWEPGKKLISIPKPRPIKTIHNPHAVIVQPWRVEGFIRTAAPGGVFEIHGFVAVNPVTREEAIYTNPKTGDRYNFARLFAVSGPGEFFPHRIESGPYQNVVDTTFHS